MSLRQISGNKWWLYGSLFLALPFMFYIMVPLGSDEFRISFDQDEVGKIQAFLQAPVAESDTTSQPNIILILADDLGKTDISLHGSQLVKTPHIDAIGQKGVVFQNGTVTSPVCSPSRAGLITGRYQQRFGYEYQKHVYYLKNRMQYYGFKYLVDSDPWHPIYTDKVPRPEDVARQGLPPTEITLAELLKKHGYHTGIIGKWHLGSADFNLPCNRGFDYQYGFYASHSLFAPEGSEGIVDQRIPEDFSDDYIWDGQRDGEHAIYRNCEEIEENGYLTDRIAEEAVDYIDENKDRPFFLYLPFSAPHTPLQVPRALYDKYSHIEDPYKRVYNAMIESLDTAVGNIIRKVEDSGLANNTLIIFLSDNGGATYTYTTDNKPLRGGKITNFEGGIVVPFLMRWDGVIPPGMQYDKQVSALDIFSTAADLARAERFRDKPLDGVNLIPFLTGSKDGPPHPRLYWKRGNNIAVRTDEWKFTHDYKSGTSLLFRINEDETESENVAAQYPEVARSMLSAHERWTAGFPPPLWPPSVYYRHEDGDGVLYFDN